MPEEIKFPYSVITTDMEEIRDGDLVDVSYHFGDSWITLGKKGSFHTTIKSVKEATIGLSERAARYWKATIGLSDEKFLMTILHCMKKHRLSVLEKKEVDYGSWATHVSVLQYHFGRNVDKQNGVWFNIMRTQEQLDSLNALDEVKKSKKQEKRRLFVRIRVPQPGGMCHEGNQVVKSWEQDLKPSFYEEIGWFNM